MSSFWLCAVHEKAMENGIAELMNGLRQIAGLDGVINVELRYRER